MKKHGGVTRIVSLLYVLVGTLVSSSAQEATPPHDDQRSAMATLTRLFGEPLDPSTLKFSASPYVITPQFSQDGALLSLDIQLNPKFNSSDLFRSEFDRLLVLLGSVKPLGKHQEDLGVTIVHGSRGFECSRYEYAYLETAESITVPRPHPVQSAMIYYIHPVTGAAKLPKGSRPSSDAFSFGLICVGKESYIAPNAEFLKVWMRPNEIRQINVAGPTGDRSVCAE